MLPERAQRDSRLDRRRLAPRRTAESNEASLAKGCVSDTKPHDQRVGSNQETTRRCPKCGRAIQPGERTGEVIALGSGTDKAVLSRLLPQGYVRIDTCYRGGFQWLACSWSDYSKISAGEYGHYVFKKIVAALAGSRGACCFNDGDIPRLNAKQTSPTCGSHAGRLLQASAIAEPTPLVDENTEFTGGIYLVGAYTDNASNLELLLLAPSPRKPAAA